jgi:hypothetical protein
MPAVVVTQFSTPVVSGILVDEYGLAISLTGKTLKFAAKRSVTDPDTQKIADITAANDADQTANKGKYTLTFTYAQTSITPGSYPASLRVWNAAPTTDPPDRVEASSYTVEAGVIATES